MPQLLYILIDPTESNDVVKSHPSGVQLQKIGSDFRVVFNGVCFVRDALQSEADIVFTLLLRQVKAPRPRTSMLGAPLDFSNLDANAVNSQPLSKEALMEKLEGFVATYNSTLVHRLVHDGKLEEAKKLLDRNPALFRLADADGDTVLHIACREDRLEFVRYLMVCANKKGGFWSDEGLEPLFDPNARNLAHWTPLHCAAFGFHFKICDLLLKEAPIAVNCVTEQNLSSPLHFLARYQDTADILAAGLPTDYSSTSSSSASVSSSYLGTSLKPGAANVNRDGGSSSASVAGIVSNNPIFKDMMEVLAGLLESGADVSARDAKGETPLHISANVGSAVVAEWLVLNRAEVNAVSYQNQETPLHVAIRGKNPVIVELLLSANTDVTAPSKYGTPLDLAQQFSSPEITRLIKDHMRSLPPNPDLSFNPEPSAAIFIPSSSSVGLKDSTSSIEQSPNSDKDVPTTLSNASIQVQEHQLLRPVPPPSSAPLPVGASTTLGQTPPSPDNGAQLAASQTGENTIGTFQAIAATLPAIAALPLVPFKQLRKVVDAVLFSPGRTPLHEAVIMNNEKVVIEILRLRPSLINTRDQQKWTPMLYAAAYGHLRLMIRLARSGADLTCTDSDESGILHFLARNRKISQSPLDFADLLDLLVLMGVNLDLANMFGATALHDSASRNNLIFLHAICQRGAKIDAVSKIGETPLIYAARENCVDAVNFLLHRGANMDHAGKFGTAVEIARSYCNLSVLKVFLFYKNNSIHIVPVESSMAKVESEQHSTPVTGFAQATPSRRDSISGTQGNLSQSSSSTTSTQPGTPRSFKLRSLSQVEPFVAAPESGVANLPSTSISPATAVISFQGSSTTTTTPGNRSTLQGSSPPSSTSRSRSKSESPNNSAIMAPNSTPDAKKPNSITPNPQGQSDALEDTDLGDRSAGSPSFSSFMSPRRHLTVTVDGAVIDYNKVYNVNEPLLAAFPCCCTITSPMALFKEIDGFLIIWQHYIAFGHVTTTSTGALIADTSFNWKVAFSQISSVGLVKSMFSSAKISVMARTENLSPEVAPNINIGLARCERLEALENLLQYLLTNKAVQDRLEIDGIPLADMVGSIMYPKENAEFRRNFPHVPLSETVLDHFSCYYKEEGAFASKIVYVTQHRIWFGKKNSVQVPFEDVKTLKKADTKTIIFETPTQKYTFTSIANRDPVFSLVESLWNAQQSDNRLVLFGALGRRTMQLCELFIEKFVKAVSGPDFYVRWILIQGYHVLDKRQQELLRDIGVEVTWLSSKSGFLAIPEILQYMRKVTLLYLDFDPKFLEVSEMILRHCNPKQLKQIMLVSLSLGDQRSYMGESISLLQDRVRETEVGFVLLQCHPAFMQMLEDEFIDIKRDWRFRLPWPGTNPKLAWLDLRDVVDVSVEIASSRDLESHRDKIYYLAGPEPLGCDDIASAITQLTEQEVRFIGVSMEEIKAILLQSLTEVTTLGPRATDSSQQSLSRTLSMEQYLPAIVTHDMSEVIAFASNSNSPIITALRTSLWKQFSEPGANNSETGLDFDTQQYLTIFSDLSSYDLHSIPSMLTADLTGRRPRTIHNFAIDHLDSFRSKGSYNFTNLQKEAATRHFTELSVALAQPNTSKIDVALFGKIFSPMLSSIAPSFATRLVSIFNPTSKPSFQLADYVKTCGILVNGEPMDQLSLSCSLFDSDHDNVITSQDIADLAGEVTSILVAVGIVYNTYSVRTILSAKGLSSYPREAPLPKPSYSGAGVSLASIDRPLRAQLTPAEFTHVLKMNRTALSSLGCLQTQAPKNDRSALKTKRSGIYVCPGNPLWETTLRLSTGISHTMQDQMTQGTSQTPEPSESDCAVDAEYKVSGPTEADTWIFHEYGGAVFRRIREACGVAAPDYLGSLGIEVTLGNLLLGKLANFEEISSTGRSGSFFLRTHNSKFLVKSLPLDEHSFLRKNLWKYYRHIIDYPNTLVARFFGLYRVRNSSGKQDVCFVIMANLFDTPLEIHEQYDLKGSTVNRYVGDKMQFWSPNIAMKDLDFHRIIHIGPERKAAFLQQAEVDAIFMESFNICDYSLLIGFHYSEHSSPDPALTATPGSLSLMASTESSPGVFLTYYYCSLIDILTQYNFKKKGESAIKSIVHRKSQISAISPNPYRKRFIRFLISILQ